MPKELTAKEYEAFQRHARDIAFVVLLFLEEERGSSSKRTEVPSNVPREIQPKRPSY